MEDGCITKGTLTPFVSIPPARGNLRVNSFGSIMIDPVSQIRQNKVEATMTPAALTA
jgi:hypothetical protein